MRPASRNTLRNAARDRHNTSRGVERCVTNHIIAKTSVWQRPNTGPSSSMCGPVGAWDRSFPVTLRFLRDRVLRPPLKPPYLEDQRVTLCLVSNLWPVLDGWPYQECKTPAGIALGVTETRKLPHHDKVVTPVRAGNDFFGRPKLLFYCDGKLQIFLCFLNGPNGWRVVRMLGTHNKT